MAAVLHPRVEPRAATVRKFHLPADETSRGAGRRWLQRQRTAPGGSTMNLGIILLSVGVVAAVLVNDLGRRRLTRRRVVRPLIISAVVAVVFIGAPASGGT